MSTDTASILAELNRASKIIAERTKERDEARAEIERLRAPDAATKGREEQFRRVMAVFHEYALDLDFDIEGCDGDGLTEIEHCRTAATELRQRIVAHVCEGANARGGYNERAGL